MELSRRTFSCLAGGLGALSVPRVAMAESYPERPVRIIVGFPPGGPSSILARLIGQSLSARLGQQFVIENRPGAGTNIATEAVVRAVADGYTLLLVTSTNAVNATLYDQLSFNFIRDVTPVAGILREPLVMVTNPAFSAKSVPEFIVYGKGHPDKINMASSGIGSPSHVAGELFSFMAGIDMVHVPYKGDAPAITSLLGGQVQVMFGLIISSLEQIRSGRLRALAVTSATRLEVLPDIPTVAEFLPGYEASAWQGIGAPRNTPIEIVDQLNKAVNAAVADSEMKARLSDLGGVPMPMTPSEFGLFIVEETEKWAKVIKFAGIKPE